MRPSRFARPRSLFRILLLSFGVMVATPAAASADPAVPTNFRSEITSIDPPLPDGVELRVLGGDSFLELAVSGGHTAVVHDYGGSAEAAVYLSFEADGTVRRNESSAAASLNETRYGTSGAEQVGGPATWKTVSTDGSYAWHDHRIHWMSPTDPPLVAGTDQVDLSHPDGSGDWELPIEVNGEEHLVRGRLLLLDAPSALGWYALIAAGVAVMIGGTTWGATRHRLIVRRVSAALVLVVCGAATVAGFAQWRDIPADAGGSVFGAAIPAFGVAAAGLALIANLLSRYRVELPALAAGVATAGGWALWRRDVLTHAVLPTPTPGLDRLATALCLAVAISVAFVLVRYPPSGSQRTVRHRGAADPT